MPRDSFLLIGCSFGREEAVYESVRRMPEIREAVLVAGVYDIVARASLGDYTEMSGLRGRIRKITGVRDLSHLSVADSAYLEK